MTSKVAKTIKDCVAGGRAELTLLIAKAYAPIPVKICSSCWSKNCQDWCNKKDFVNKMNYFFIAGDNKEGLINVRITPWFEGDGSKVKENHIYKITGEVQEYKGKLDLIAEEIEVITPAVA